MLTALLIIPLIGSIALLPIAEGTAAGDSRMKRIALATSMVNFFVSIVLWGEFDSSASQYQFVQEFNNLSFCHFHIGVDGISLYFVLLTTFITPICILSNWDSNLTSESLSALVIRFTESGILPIGRLLCRVVAF